MSAMAPMKQSSLLLVTSRPAVRTFFESLAADATPPFEVSPVPAGSDLVAEYAEYVARATVAVMDTVLDPDAAITWCQEVHALRPSLPMTALFCCPHAVTPEHLRALVATGVSNVFDLQATAEEVLRVLQSIVRGDVVLHVRMNPGHSTLLGDVATDQELREDIGIGSGPALTRPLRQLLELLVHGLSDQEIGRQLHLSPHTIKHHIEHLRDEVGARNRIELAAWASQQGFYLPS